MVPFVQFKKREKQPWRSVNFIKVAAFKPATLLKLTLPYGYFSSFLKFTNGTKSCNAPHILTGNASFCQLITLNNLLLTFYVHFPKAVMSLNGEMEMQGRLNQFWIITTVETFRH